MDTTPATPALIFRDYLLDPCRTCGGSGVETDSDDSGALVRACDCPAGERLSAKRLHDAAVAAYRPPASYVTPMERVARQQYADDPWAS